MIRVEWTYSVGGAPPSLGFCEAYSNVPRWRAFEALEAHLAGAHDLSPLADLARWLVRVEGLDLKGFMNEVYLAQGVRVRFSIA
ncbi:hypothetical protein ACEZDB_38660 [Streptacidiphilus sp. N1-3]|uniref:Uncharacterized protein n=1 Tax=Streptacidiphilus alkalitolerans TaxID=3342712 RepID=A0ABV6XE83_9ACTN